MNIATRTVEPKYKVGEVVFLKEKQAEKWFGLPEGERGGLIIAVEYSIGGGVWWYSIIPFNYKLFFRRNRVLVWEGALERRNEKKEN